MACGGRACKYENPSRWSSEEQAIKGLYSSWITDNLLAMARPSTQFIEKFNIIKQFQTCGLKTIITGEHASCSHTLEPESGFTYRPEVFMEVGRTMEWHPRLRFLTGQGQEQTLLCVLDCAAHLLSIPEEVENAFVERTIKAFTWISSDSENGQLIYKTLKEVVIPVFSNMRAKAIEEQEVTCHCPHIL